MLSVTIFVSIICIILGLSLFGVLISTANLNSQIQTKDSQIAELNNQITDLNQQLNDASGQDNVIARMQKVIDLMDSLFFGRGHPIDTFTGTWSGNWAFVTNLQGNTNPTNTQTFQVSNPYHLFRLNITLTGSTGGNMQFAVVEKVESEEITTAIYSITIDNAPTEKNTVYLFSESLGTKTYYLKIQNYQDITSWDIRVEQLDQ